MRPERNSIVQILFPDGVPNLWCPPLTHFATDGSFDVGRTAAHLEFLAPSVGGLLVPGTTGEGWELSDLESAQLVRLVGALARKHRMTLLIGILKPTVEGMLVAVDRTLAEIAVDAKSDGLPAALRERNIAGFAFCAPTGKNLTQEQIESGLRTVFDLGLPSALYQLPQVTGNEVAPATAERLIAAYANLLLVKDSSGGDRLLLARQDPAGLFYFRGAEGDYYEWCRGRAERYDGFLLSTANCFPRQLAEILSPEVGAERAQELSRRVTGIVNESFEAVAAVREGNAFTNVNKAIDHFNAHGAGAADLPGPRLHGGAAIPPKVIRRIGSILASNGMLPETGYLLQN